MIKVTIVNHEDFLEQTLDLFRLVFRETTVENWRWRHINNPFAEGRPEVVIAMDGEKLIGANCFMPINFMFNGKVIRAIQSRDSTVHPDYRKLGIFSKMIRVAETYYRDVGYSFVFGFPNQNSMPGFLKLGWKQFKSLEYFDLPLNFKNLIQRLMPGLPFKDVIDKIYTKFIGRGCLDQTMSSDKGSFEVSDRYPDILRDVTDLYNPTELELNRNRAFLQWRIEGNSIWFFRYVYLCDHQGLVWYTLVGQYDHEKSGLKLGQIIDSKVRGNEEKTFNDAMLASVRVLANGGCDTISVIRSFSNHLQTINMRKLGFWRLLLL